MQFIYILRQFHKDVALRYRNVRCFNRNVLKPKTYVWIRFKLAVLMNILFRIVKIKQCLSCIFLKKWIKMSLQIQSSTLSEKMTFFADSPKTNMPFVLGIFPWLLLYESGNFCRVILLAVKYLMWEDRFVTFIQIVAFIYGWPSALSSYFLKHLTIGVRTKLL